MSQICLLFGNINFVFDFGTVKCFDVYSKVVLENHVQTFPDEKIHTCSKINLYSQAIDIIINVIRRQTVYFLTLIAQGSSPSAVFQ
jgi:hypothetical protein